jgi:hypothetical protein
MAAASPAPPGNFQVARPACWFPLALFGVIVAMSVPLYAAQLSTSAFSSWLAYGPLTRTMSSTSGYGAFYSTLAGTLGPDTGLTGIAEGWYWAAALTAGFLVTAVWYRRAGRGGLIPRLDLAVRPVGQWQCPVGAPRDRRRSAADPGGHRLAGAVRGSGAAACAGDAALLLVPGPGALLVSGLRRLGSGTAPSVGATDP